MIKKQLIGSVLMLLFISELIAFEINKSFSEYFAYRVYGMTQEMLFFFIGLSIFLLVLAAGTLIWKKHLLLYSSICWVITSGILGLFGLWTLILTMNTSKDTQSAVYYIIGSFQSQTAVSLAVLALCVSHELKNRFFPAFVWLCLIFSCAVTLLHLCCMNFNPVWHRFLLYGFLIDTVPVSIIIALILFILKEKKVLPIILKTVVSAALTVGAYAGALVLLGVLVPSDDTGSLFVKIAISVGIIDAVYTCTVKFWPIKNVYVKKITGFLLFAISAAIVTCYIILQMIVIPA